jgi:hypothetical protein
MSFSHEFLSEFLPTRTYHGCPTSQIEYKNGNQFNPHQKLLIVEEVVKNGQYPSKIAHYLGTSRRRIQKIVKQSRDGHFFQIGAGRPIKIDETGMEHIKYHINSAKINKNPIKEDTLIKLIHDGACITAENRGKHSVNVDISRTTAWRFAKAVKISKEQGQATTTARYREGKDIRNFLSMAAMNEAFSKNKLPQMIGNFDSTQFIISNKNKQLCITIKNNNDDDPVTNVEDANLDQAIKWFMICNANGNLGPDVFLVANPDMDKEEFTHTTILGLTHNVSPDAFGYLCMTKTRCGNPRFFKWFIGEIIPLFVDKCRQHLPRDIEDTSFYMVTDGEKLQIEPLDDAEVNQKLTESQINIGKGPASCTGTIGNAADRSHLFKATKKVLKTQPTILEDNADILLSRRVCEYFKINHPCFSDSKANFLADGLVKVVRSLNKVVTYSITAHGFQRIGVFPLDPRKCMSNLDKTILDRISVSDMDLMISNIPTMVEMFLNGGQITEDQFDELEIPTYDGGDHRTRPKDQRVLSHQRAVMMNSLAAITRRKEWLRRNNSKISLELEDNDDCRPRKKRKPNRPKHVIEEEKRAKEARKLLKRK